MTELVFRPFGVFRITAIIERLVEHEGSVLLLESGGALLLEPGGTLILEGE
jgi:hypothetical protein